MIITKGCSQCKSETEHCDECSEQIKLEISHTPPNRDGEIVIDFDYANSKGETVAVSDWKKLRGESTKGGKR
jgi:hypothetical protein